MEAGHAIVVGFGVAGRAFVDYAVPHGWTYTAIDLNQPIVDRCRDVGKSILFGDARDRAVLQAAGIDRATAVLITIPNEAMALETVSAIRAVRSDVRIIARCTYVSTGFEAVRRGATDVVVAEELAAREFVRLVEGGKSATRAK